MDSQPNNKTNPVGRPTKYYPGMCQKVKKMKGLTHVDMANNLGVSITQFNIYRKNYPAFALAVKVADENTNSIVENALFKRATGFKYTEERTERFMGDDGPVTKVTKTKKKVVPDTAAAFIWLKNRKPEAWRDRIEVVRKNTEVRAVLSLNGRDALEYLKDGDIPGPEELDEGDYEILEDEE
jgi:hypothetical protein